MKTDICSVGMYPLFLLDTHSFLFLQLTFWYQAVCILLSITTDLCTACMYLSSLTNQLTPVSNDTLTLALSLYVFIEVQFLHPSAFSPSPVHSFLFRNLYVPLFIDKATDSPLFKRKLTFHTSLYVPLIQRYSRVSGRMYFPSFHEKLTDSSLSLSSDNSPLLLESMISPFNSQLTLNRKYVHCLIDELTHSSSNDN